MTKFKCIKNFSWFTKNNIYECYVDYRPHCNAVVLFDDYGDEIFVAGPYLKNNFTEIKKEYKMQEIILNPPKPKELLVEDLKNSDHVGCFCKDGEKWFINHCPGGFSLVDSVGYDISCNNTYVRRKSLKECVDNAYVQKAYKFNTRKELFRWLSE